MGGRNASDDEHEDQGFNQPPVSLWDNGPTGGDQDYEEEYKLENPHVSALKETSAPQSPQRRSVMPYELASQAATLRSMRQREVDQKEEDHINIQEVYEQGRLIGYNSPDQEDVKYVSNAIRTSKYNIVTFLPTFLFEMFSRLAYVYFLLQACVAWWKTVSPLSGWGSTLALSFVLTASGIKAGLEDWKRHQEDHQTNTSKTIQVMSDGSEKELLWKDVKVGMLIKVKDNELFPADLLCLMSSLPENVCFIRTTNLDGESNLKIRRPVDIKDDAGTIEQVAQVRCSLQCEPPSSNLHHFKGRFTYFPEEQSITQPPTAQFTDVAVTMNELMLRGCMLKNTGYIIGLVVYTGDDTRIQRNAQKTPLKSGTYDKFLNIQITVIIILQIILCFICSGISVLFRAKHGKRRYYLQFDKIVEGNYESDVLQLFLMTITFWILYSYLVPISLFVTMEVVKFSQGVMFMNNDPSTIDEDGEQGLQARNTNLNEDLGKVKYIFSDKTGTLTSNEMRLRMIAIKGVEFGSTEFRLEECEETDPQKTIDMFDQNLGEACRKIFHHESRDILLNRGGSTNQTLALPTSSPKEKDYVKAHVYSKPNVQKPPKKQKQHRLSYTGARPAANSAVQQLKSFHSKSSSCRLNTRQLQTIESGRLMPSDPVQVLGSHFLDFWTNICICHSLIVEERDDGTCIFQGPSPDEVALVEAGKRLGFEYVNRSVDSITLNMQGIVIEHQILNILEFTSERKRMSVIARAPDGTIRLYCKGADSTIINLLRKDMDVQLLDHTQANLDSFAVQGLRTLALGTRVLSESQWMQWDAKYQVAAQSLADREAEIAAVATQIECELELVGVTAIEDKLQDEVIETIISCLDAGIRVWMITGDKQETAINIAISCGLFREGNVRMTCNASNVHHAKLKLKQLTQQAEVLEREQQGVPWVERVVPELVLDGKTLTHILSYSEAEKQLAVLAAMCGAVVVCRASPSQKAKVVQMMRAYEERNADAKKGKHFFSWYGSTMYKLSCKMLAIGDGANDVAMIQAADVGVGIAGKEGRQAVNNSDYSLTQFKYLRRLLFVHGECSAYRLSNLIKFSFMKNIAFAMAMFFYQFYCGFSGQTLVDSISGNLYNVIFSSMPILFFALFDRPVKSYDAMENNPFIYNSTASLAGRVFWKTGVLQGVIYAAICFFIPYYSSVASGQNSINGVFPVGKTIYVALLGAVTLEVVLVSRYMTNLFLWIVLLSYSLVYPFFLCFPMLQEALGSFVPHNLGVGMQLFTSPNFWLQILLCNALSVGTRFLEKSIKETLYPDRSMLLNRILLSRSETSSTESGEIDFQNNSLYSKQTEMTSIKSNGGKGLSSVMETHESISTQEENNQAGSGHIAVGIVEGKARTNDEACVEEQSQYQRESIGSSKSSYRGTRSAELTILNSAI